MNTEVRDFEGFKASLRCFDYLDGVLPGASDIDLLCEVDNRFLVLEGKPREGPQVWVPYGQWRALLALAGQAAFTVWLVADDQKAKQDETVSRYALLRLTTDLEPDVPCRRHNGVKSVAFFTDHRFEHLTLSGLQDCLLEWRDAA